MTIESRCWPVFQDNCPFLAFGSILFYHVHIISRMVFFCCYILFSTYYLMYLIRHCYEISAILFKIFSGFYLGPSEAYCTYIHMNIVYCTFTNHNILNLSNLTFTIHGCYTLNLNPSLIYPCNYFSKSMFVCFFSLFYLFIFEDPHPSYKAAGTFPRHITMIHCC